MIQLDDHFPRRTLLALLVAFPALALLTQLQAATNAPLRVGVSPVFPPMIFKQGKELKGVEVELAKALGNHLNREIVFVEVPWKDQIEALNEGRTDIIMSSMSVTPARKYVVNFSKPYFVTGQMALVRREDKNNYALGFPYKLNGNVGVLKATTGEFLVQRDFPKSPLKSYSSGEEAAKALVKKKINLFITDSTLVWYLAGTHANEGLTAVPIALSEETLAYAVRKQDDTLLASVNDFITKGNQDGTFLKVFKRWTAVGE
ncbi:MAG TPA: transporter substrate-binding domain-containing protein [Verrucomicrobiae bacterium]|nr:transporter substrate-binding domain-containing protein [Verrucomicrobiae bacterium]